MTVMFVDDEVKVLDGLRRMHLARAITWPAVYATTGNDALRRLREGGIEVLVSDMQMPGMDGPTLLHAAFQADPRCARIVLSGQADEIAAIRVLPVAHRFLSKPCSAETVFAVVEAARMRRSRLSEVAQRVVGSVGTLPAVPKVYCELLRLLTEPDVDAARVAALVSRDPVIASRLLQLANSAFLARSARVSDVTTAVRHVGTRNVRAIALSASVFSLASETPDTSMALGRIQRTSEAAYAIARRIAARGEAQEQASTAALLADVGSVVFAAKAPRAYLDMLDQVASGLPIEAVAQKTFGATPCELGAALLDHWGLPEVIVAAVEHHARPLECRETAHADVVTLVHAARALADGRAPDLPALEARNMLSKLNDWSAVAQELGALAAPAA